MEQMTLEEFNRLATGNRVALVVALELLLQNGRRVIQQEDPMKLVASCKAPLGGFFAEDAFQEIVGVCRKLAALDTNVLVAYIRHSSLDLKALGVEETGVCPICGGELEYGSDITLDDGGYHEWRCPGCGATGKEMYGKIFEEHYDVIDGSGKPYHTPTN